MKLKENLDKESIGAFLYLSLRKICNSKATSAMYNAIPLVNVGVWLLYLQSIWNSLKDKKEFKDQKALSEVVKQAWGDIYRMESVDPDDPIFQERQILKIKFPHDNIESQIILLGCIGDLMNEEDWERFVECLFDRTGE